MNKVIISYIFIFTICFLVNELKACDNTWAVGFSNTIDLGTGNYQMDVEVCIGDGGSENGFSSAFSGLNVLSFSPPNLTEGAKTAVGSSASNVLDYVYPGDGVSGDVFVGAFAASCFNYTVVLDGDPGNTDVIFTGVNCESLNCPQSCAFAGGNIAIGTVPENIFLTCDDIFTDDPANNYINNQNKFYTICPADPNYYVTITFSAFNLETDYDFLTIYNGNNSNGSIMGILTGTSPPGSFISTAASGCLFAHFTSDDSVTGPGWLADIDCSPILFCDEIFTDGPSDYDNDVSESYRICPMDSGDLVTLNFTAFDLENGSDFMTVYDGDDDNATSLGTFSGSAIPNLLTSTAASGCLFVIFISNDSGTDVGWSANTNCCIDAPASFLRG